MCKLMPFDGDVFDARAKLMVIAGKLKTTGVVFVKNGLLDFARRRKIRICLKECFCKGKQITIAKKVEMLDRLFK